MDEKLFERDKFGSSCKIFADAKSSLKPNLSMLHSFDKKIWKWTYFKHRFVNLKNKSDKHIARGFISGMNNNFVKKSVSLLLKKTFNIYNLSDAIKTFVLSDNNMKSPNGILLGVILM